MQRGKEGESVSMLRAVMAAPGRDSPTDEE